MASPDRFTPYWQKCLGHARCQECGSFVGVTWRWFAELATWTRCYCETCVETMLDAHDPAQ